MVLVRRYPAREAVTFSSNANRIGRSSALVCFGIGTSMQDYVHLEAERTATRDFWTKFDLRLIWVLLEDYFTYLDTSITLNVSLLHQRYYSHRCCWDVLATVFMTSMLQVLDVSRPGAMFLLTRTVRPALLSVWLRITREWYNRRMRHNLWATEGNVRMSSPDPARRHALRQGYRDLLEIHLDKIMEETHTVYCAYILYNVGSGSTRLQSRFHQVFVRRMTWTYLTELDTVLYPFRIDEIDRHILQS
jgi:hypothetical protein